jgi:hypothetical protein
MFEEQSQQISSSGSPARTLIAIILLALAIPLGIRVLTIVSATIKDTDRPAILQKVYPDEDKPVTINTPTGKIELPPQVFMGFSYMVLFMFLLIPTSIAMALLKGGITLLKPDMAIKMMRGLVESLVKIQAPKE